MTLLTYGQVAERLGVSERTVRRFVSRGDLPAKRLSDRVVRIDTTDLDRWLDTRHRQRKGA